MGRHRGTSLLETTHIVLSRKPRGCGPNMGTPHLRDGKHGTEGLSLRFGAQAHTHIPEHGAEHCWHPAKKNNKKKRKKTGSDISACLYWSHSLAMCHKGLCSAGAARSIGEPCLRHGPFHGWLLAYPGTSCLAQGSSQTV